MPTRPTLFLLASWLVLPGLAGAQESTDLTPEKVAEIRRDDAQAQAKVNEEFGNRKPSELSNEERTQAIDKQQAASAAVLEKHGVSAKEYARYEARMGPEGNARAKAEQQRLEAQAQAAKQPPAPTEEKAAEDVPVQLGFSEQDPVELEATEDAEPIVELGVPGGGEEGGDAVPVEVGAVQEEAKPAKKPAARAPAAKKKKVVKRRRSSGGD
ncbi:hypothetical protein [Pyxidicoccus parkwayensis]|jgi:hypothetical protein|uniref:hypothetical protein n=1 Tax=Pyxidicoccus parkwayensis TaxID=2813578 RepID=UPI001F51301E|nr:hypothetical protein [Pyxidicoccus parkwaysis]